MSQKENIVKKVTISPYIIEVVAMLERALAFAYTGDSRVLTKTLMGPFGLSRSLIELGLPAITTIDFNTHLSRHFAHNPALWPLTSSREPAVASKRALSLTYGDDHFYVSIKSHFLHSAHMDDGRCAHTDDGRCAHTDDGRCAHTDDGRCAHMDDGRCAHTDDGRCAHVGP